MELGRAGLGGVVTRLEPAPPCGQVGNWKIELDPFNIQGRLDHVRDTSGQVVSLGQGKNCHP